jgi:hypothetical protein
VVLRNVHSGRAVGHGAGGDGQASGAPRH